MTEAGSYVDKRPLRNPNLYVIGETFQLDSPRIFYLESGFAIINSNFERLKYLKAFLEVYEPVLNSV